jgi:hypothetical protein
MTDRLTRRWVVLVGLPVAYAGLLLFHPVPGPGPIAEAIAGRLFVWNVVHIGQLPFICALGCALWILVGTDRGVAATVARLSGIVFVVTYGAYESWTGIGTGLLTSAAVDLDPPARSAAVAQIQLHWQSPWLGTVSVGAIVGSTAWLVAAAGAASVLRAGGASTVVVMSLALSGLAFAPTHVPPGGPIAMALFAFAGYQLGRPAAGRSAPASPSATGGAAGSG